MSSFRRWGLSALLLCLPVGLSIRTARAADDAPPAPDAKTENALIHRTLRDVINEGADMYNATGRYQNTDRDFAGCYHLYEGALMMVKPLLSRHANLQKAIDDALTTARDTPKMEERAFVLRAVIDKIREEVNPKSTTVVGPTTPVKPQPPVQVKPYPPTKETTPVEETTTTTKGKIVNGEKGKLIVLVDGKSKTFTIPESAKVLINGKEGKLEELDFTRAGDVAITSKGDVVTKVDAHVEAKLPTPPPPSTPTLPAAAKSLWDRLGGEANVAKVVDDFVNMAGKDPKVNFWRDPTRVPSKEEIADLKTKLVEFVSSATGGPLKYEGKSMKEAHKGMKITNEEFDAAAKDLIDALEKNHAKADDVMELMKIVGSTRKDIVEAKEPEEKTKPEEEKKPEEKTKPEEKSDDKGGVIGNVTFNGKPLKGGVVKMIDADGKMFQSDLKADGGYEIKDLKPGSYSVAVDTESLNDPDKPNPAYVEIPAKYRSAKTSGLTFEIKNGKNVLDVALVDPAKLK